MWPGLVEFRSADDDIRFINRMSLSGVEWDKVCVKGDFLTGKLPYSETMRGYYYLLVWLLVRVLCYLILVKLAPVNTKILHSHGFLSHILLWPWPLIVWPQNDLISTSMSPNASVTEIGWNFVYWFLRYGVHGVFGLLWPWPLTFGSHNLTSTSMNPNTSWPKLGEAFFIGLMVSDMVFTKFLGRTDSQSHSRTGRPENRIPPAPKVFSDGGI